MKMGKKYPVYISKNTFNRHVDLLFVENKGKFHYILIKKRKLLNLKVMREK